MRRDHFELFTFDDAAAGSELLISYGSGKSNFELMRDYGFILPCNRADMVFLVDDLKRLLYRRPDLRAPSRSMLQAACLRPALQRTGKTAATVLSCSSMPPPKCWVAAQMSPAGCPSSYHRREARCAHENISVTSGVTVPAS
jgi:hypothetical protein